MTVASSTETPFRSKVGAQLVLGFALIAIWEATATWLVDPFWIGKPSAIAQRLWDVFVHGDMLTHTGVTLFHSVVGLLLSLVIGVPIGILFAARRSIADTVEPYFLGFYSLPRVALAPLFILWFGIGELPKVLLVALGVSFPLYLNTFSAIRQVDPKLFETAQVLGFSFWQRFRTIIVPSAAPQVLVGLRQSLAIAWLTLIVAEQINADKGIGFLINNARDFLRIDIIIFGLIVYALLGIGTDAVVRALERRALRYRA